jgi:hypothetical protein
VVLDENGCDGSDLGTISKVELVARVYGTSGKPSLYNWIVYRLRPLFDGVPGDGYSYEWHLDEGQVWFSCDITGDSAAPGVWSWSDIAGLGCEFWDWQHHREDRMCGYGYRVGIQVTYSLWTEIGTNSSVGNGTYSRLPTDMNNFNTTYYWAVLVEDGTNSTTAQYQFITRIS